MLGAGCWWVNGQAPLRRTHLDGRMCSTKLVPRAPADWDCTDRWESRWAGRRAGMRSSVARSPPERRSCSTQQSNQESRSQPTSVAVRRFKTCSRRAIYEQATERAAAAPAAERRERRRDGRSPPASSQLDGSLGGQSPPLRRVHRRSGGGQGASEAARGKQQQEGLRARLGLAWEG